MSKKTVKTLEVKSRRKWRTWLSKHHESNSEVWLVFNKRHTGLSSLGYNDAVEEALCFGWIDSIIKRIDDARYARKFTPRKADSKWSLINRQRYADLKSLGLLAPAGLERGPTGRGKDGRGSGTPAYIEKQLKTNAHAWQHFEQLAPSYREGYIRWIDSAKRPETKQKRLIETIRRLAAAKKLASASEIPAYIEKQLKTNARAWQYFEQLAPSYKRAYVRWIESAQQRETKEKHLREAIKLLASGKKLGLK